MMHIQAKALIICLFFLSASISVNAQNSANTKNTELRAVVDRTSVSVNETLSLSVIYSGNQRGEQPDFSELSQQFEILSTSQSNQFRSVNGQTTSFTEWSLVIIPLEEGRLLIPSFRFAGAVSDAIEINVSPEPVAPTGAVKEIFLETVVDKESVYVQEQLTLTYRLYYSINIDSLDTEPLNIDNILLEKLEDVRYNRKIKGKTYGIAEFRYAIFPQKSGKFEIPALRWDIQTPKPGQRRNYFGFSGRSEIKRLRTESKIIDVKPRPANYPVGAAWIPAAELELNESWTTSPSEFNPGEPNTRTITLTASGLMSAQLPTILTDIESDSVKAYADQPKLEDSQEKDKGFMSKRVESAAIIVTGNDAILPSIRLPWWNIEKDRLEYAEIPARALKLKAQALNENNDNALSSSNTNANAILKREADQNLTQELGGANAVNRFQIILWQIIALICFISASVFAFLWLRIRRLPHHEIDETPYLVQTKNAFKNLIEACKTNNTAKIRGALLAWAQSHWAQQSITTLDKVAALIQHNELKAQLSAIDASLYSSNKEANKEANIDGKIIISAIRDHLVSQQKTGQDNKLVNFYANA